MSYKLVDANDLAMRFPEIEFELESIPHVFVDLPNGLDGEGYDAIEWSVPVSVIRDVRKAINSELNEAFGIEDESKSKDYKEGMCFGLAHGLEILDKQLRDWVDAQGVE